MNFSKFVLAATMATVAGENCEVNFHVVDENCIVCPDGKTNVSGDDPAGGDDTTCDDDAFTATATYADETLNIDISNVSTDLNRLGDNSEVEIIFPRRPDGTLAFDAVVAGWNLLGWYGRTMKLTPATITTTESESNESESNESVENDAQLRKLDDATWPTNIIITGITDKTKFASTSKITINYILDATEASTAIKKSTAKIDVPESLVMASSGSSLSVLSLALLLVA